MKITFSELNKYYRSIMEVGDLKLPRVVRVAIARNIVILSPEIRVYEQQRNEILKQYAKKDDKGNIISKPAGKGRIEYDIAPENMPGVINEFDVLDATIVEINNIQTFPATALDLCDETDRYDIPTAAQEASLSWMIEEKEEENG